MIRGLISIVSPRFQPLPQIGPWCLFEHVFIYEIFRFSFLSPFDPPPPFSSLFCPYFLFFAHVVSFLVYPNLLGAKSLVVVVVVVVVFIYEICSFMSGNCNTNPSIWISDLESFWNMCYVINMFNSILLKCIASSNLDHKIMREFPLCHWETW
jgi:hypothetical protein